MNLNVKRRAALFLVSQSITLFGSTLVQMAIVWYATIATGSGTWVAAFSICSYLPQFAVSFIGGVWADRFPRRLLIAGADLGIVGVTLIMILFMPMLSEAHTLLAALLVLSVVRSVGAGVQTPAVNATVPLLVPADSRMGITAATAATSPIRGITSMEAIFRIMGTALREEPDGIIRKRRKRSPESL